MSEETNTKQQPEGVYKNKRLMHACTTIVGSTVHLQTKDGSIWEGIFSTFSPNFTICLDLAVQIDLKQASNKDSLYAALKSGSEAKNKAFFDLKDIVRITSVDVDLNYATKKAIGKQLGTDSDISGYDPTKVGEHKQLESWQDEDGDDINAADSMLSLDEVATNTGNKSDRQNNSRGWDAQEMFRYNERVHKVTTTYDEKLTGYTLPLPKHDNEEWRKKNEQAASLAQEIEGNQKSQSRLAKEDDDDGEEEKFSAVLRPLPQPINSQATNQQQQPKQQPQSHQQPPQQQPQQPQQHQHQPPQQQPQHQQPSPPQQQHQPQNQQQQQQHQSPQQPQQHHQQPPSQQQQQQQPPPQQQSQQQQSQQQQQGNRHLQMNQKNFRNRNNKSSKIDELKNFANKMTLGGPSTSASPISQSELVKKSKLNPYAKEFVLKPRSPAVVDPNLQVASNNWAATNGAVAGGVAGAGTPMDPATSSPMAQQGPHTPYGYPQMPIFPHGMPPHAQPPQFIPNHQHPHFQSQIHYMMPVPSHFAQQMQPQRFVRGQPYQNYRPVCDCCPPWNC